MILLIILVHSSLGSCFYRSRKVFMFISRQFWFVGRNQRSKQKYREREEERESGGHKAG